jgi:hypothetical protein
LALLQHAPEFYTSQGRLCGPERFEAEHGSNYALDEPVILLYHVIQIFALANLDAFLFVYVVLLDDGCIGAAFVDIDQTGLAVGTDSFIEKSQSSFLVSPDCKQEINGVTFFVDGAIEIFPLAFEAGGVSTRSC